MAVIAIACVILGEALLRPSPPRVQAPACSLDCGRRVAASALAVGLTCASRQRPAAAIDEYTKLGAGLRGDGKKKSVFGDFNLTESGLQFKDFKLGNGDMPKKGDRVVVDWDGVTIGYQGRYFQTRNKPKVAVTTLACAARKTPQQVKHSTVVLTLRVYPFLARVVRLRGSIRLSSFSSKWGIRV